MSQSKDQGVPASPSGHSRAEPEEVSVVPTSVPNAAWAREWGDEFLRLTKDELHKSFLRWCKRWRPRWWAKFDARQAYEDGFTIGARSAFLALQEVQNFAVSGLASGIETQSATTAGRGPQDESPTAATSGGDAQGPTS